MQQIKGRLGVFRQRTRFHSQSFQWQGGYAALTVSQWNLTTIAHYIRNQKQHHAENTTLPRMELPKNLPFKTPKPNNPTVFREGGQLRAQRDPRPIILDGFTQRSHTRSPQPSRTRSPNVPALPAFSQRSPAIRSSNVSQTRLATTRYEPGQHSKTMKTTRPLWLIASNITAMIAFTISTVSPFGFLLVAGYALALLQNAENAARFGQYLGTAASLSTRWARFWAAPPLRASSPFTMRACS